MKGRFNLYRFASPATFYPLAGALIPYFVAVSVLFATVIATAPAAGWATAARCSATDSTPSVSAARLIRLRIMSRARFGEHGLPADWLQVDPTGTWAPATDKPARFGFDAIRIPLYAEAGRRKALSEPVVAWWQSLASSGQQIPAWIDLQSGQVAPYGLSAGGNAIMALALGRPQPDVLAGDYYAAVLQLFARYVK